MRERERKKERKSNIDDVMGRTEIDDDQRTHDDVFYRHHGYGPDTMEILLKVCHPCHPYSFSNFFSWTYDTVNQHFSISVTAYCFCISFLFTTIHAALFFINIFTVYFLLLFRSSILYLTLTRSIFKSFIITYRSQSPGTFRLGTYE